MRLSRLLHSANLPALLAAALVSISMLAIAPAQVHAVSADPVVDPALRACINETIGDDSASPVNLEELQTLRSLTCESEQIVSLEGLELAHSLTELLLTGESSQQDCDAQEAINLYPIAKLSSLQVVELSCLGVQDLSALSNISSLTDLSLPGNQITDISTLTGLTSLVSLSLIDNAVSDLAPLSTLTSLETLSLGGNQVSDASPLATLDQLRFLSLTRNQLADIQPLAGNYALEDLLLSNNNITDIGPLAGLTNLQTLQIASNQLTDISPLKSLKHLRFLDANDQEIELPHARVGQVLPIEIRGIQGNLIAPENDDSIHTDETSITPQKSGSLEVYWGESTVRGLFGASFSGAITVEVAPPSQVWKWIGIGSAVTALIAAFVWLRLLARKRDRAFAQVSADKSGL